MDNVLVISMDIDLTLTILMSSSYRSFRGTRNLAVVGCKFDGEFSSFRNSVELYFLVLIGLLCK
jgi:hypothetical protein